MRIAQIKNGIVVNVIEADSVWSSNDTDSFIPSNIAGIGWVMVAGELQPAPIDYILNAEEFIKSYFSTAKLLQCKVWFDLIPHASTPKLVSLFQWTSTVTGLSLQNINTFPACPVTFIEVAQECVPLL